MVGLLYIGQLPWPSRKPLNYSLVKVRKVNAKDVGYGIPLDTVGLFYDTATKAKDADLANLLRKHGGNTGEELKAKGK